MARSAAQPRGSGPRGRRLPPGERRAHLLEVAAGILLSEGPQGLTMERVAQRAGVSKGLGYAYFADADDLARALWDREAAVVYESVEAAFSLRRSLEGRLRRAVGAYFDVITERGALLGALEAHFGSTRVRRGSHGRVREFVAFWTRQLEEALSVDAALAGTLAGMIIRCVEAGARAWSGGFLDRTRAEALCAAFVVAGTKGALQPSGRS